MFARFSFLILCFFSHIQPVQFEAIDLVSTNKTQTNQLICYLNQRNGYFLKKKILVNFFLENKNKTKDM